MTLRRMKVWWLKARIAHHMRQADSYNQAIARSFRRDHYGVWTRNMALRHAVKAHDLKRRLGAARN